MINASGRNGAAASAGTLFDIDQVPAAAAVCAREGCGKPVPVAESGRGRPGKYCSKACKSKAERARAKNAGPAADPSGPARATDGALSVAMLGGPRAALADCAAQAARVVEEFLAAVDADPADAYARFLEQQALLRARVEAAAVAVRDEARRPGPDKVEREPHRAEAELAVEAGAAAPRELAGTRSGRAGDPPRGEIRSVGAEFVEAGETPRGEIQAAGAESAVAGETPRSAIRSALRPCTDPGTPAPVLQVPYDLALGRPTGWLPPTGRALGAPARSYSLGGGLVHLTWPHRPGVQALEQQGVVAGWIELWDTDTPDTPGAAGAAVPWAALIDGSPVVDAADGEVLLAPAPDAALALLRHALDQQQSARIARLPRDSRPLPSTAPYDQLLHRPAARNQAW